MILEKRMDRPHTYTDIYLAFDAPAPQGNTYKMQALSSNLITGYEVFSVASNTFIKHAKRDVDASIQTTLMYKKTGEFTIPTNLGDLASFLSTTSCFVKVLPISLLLDV